jgi:putative lipoic acid-binding regulatory protein
MDEKTKAFYERLKEELSTTSTWPALYLYKFIVPTDKEKIIAIEGAFDNLGAVIRTTQSKNGKFTSVSVNVEMKSPEHVIEKYQAVSTIEGIISL